MKLSFIGIAAIIALHISSSAFADQSIGIHFELPGAPHFGDTQDQIDYQTLLDYQSKRTQAECNRASSEVDVSLASFYGAPYGPLTSSEITKWKSFMLNMEMKAFLTIAAAKNKWKRPRPFVSHADLHPCIDLERSTSYPSGHSAIAEYFARMLSVAFPERSAALEARAAQIALDRNVGGVHYPTDIRDGLLLGDQIFDAENKDGKLESRIRNF